jgi:hypothetical protein
MGLRTNLNDSSESKRIVSERDWTERKGNCDSAPATVSCQYFDGISGDDQLAIRSATIYTLIVSTELKDVGRHDWLADMLACLYWIIRKAHSELFRWNWPPRTPFDRPTVMRAIGTAASPSRLLSSLRAQYGQYRWPRRPRDSLTLLQIYPLI